MLATTTMTTTKRKRKTVEPLCCLHSEASLIDFEPDQSLNLEAKPNNGFCSRSKLTLDCKLLLLRFGENAAGV